MSEELNPCPFCGCTDFRIWELNETKAVNCNKCGADTPIEIWNTRPIESKLRAMCEEMAWCVQDAINTLSLGDIGLDDRYQETLTKYQAMKGKSNV